jgi:small subunit ribosomal protein S6
MSAAICPKGGANNMAKITEKYEALYIINPQLTEDETKALVEKFKAMVEAEGTLTAIDEWGKRRLAYLVDDLAEGYYVLMNFESKPEFPAELDRVMKITDGIMRCLITTVEE